MSNKLANKQECFWLMKVILIEKCDAAQRPVSLFRIFFPLLWLKYKIPKYAPWWRIPLMATGIKWNKYFRQLAYGGSSCGYVNFRKSSSYLRLLLLVITSCEPSAYHLCRSMCWKQPLFKALKPAGASAHCYYRVFDFFCLFFVLEALKSDCEFVENWLCQSSQVNLQMLWGTACVLFLWGVILTAVLTLIQYVSLQVTLTDTVVTFTPTLCPHCVMHMPPTVPPLTCWSDMEVWSGALLPYCYLEAEESATMSSQNWSEANSTCRLRGCFQKF